MKTLKTLLAAIVFVGFTTSAMANDQDDATIGAAAEIFRVLTIDDEEDLDFGVIFIGEIATLNPQDNTRNNVGELDTDESFGLFSIAGNPNASFSVTLPGTTTLNGPGEGNTITVALADYYGYADAGGDTYDANNVSQVQTGNSRELNSNGEGWIWVGGQIDLSETTPENGEYTGDIQVTVDYDDV